MSPELSQHASRHRLTFAASDDQGPGVKLSLQARDFSQDPLSLRLQDAFTALHDLNHARPGETTGGPPKCVLLATPESHGSHKE
jgi:hypothetical protein